MAADPSPLGGVENTILALADAFDSLRVQWAIGGSVASTTYGEPRATDDVDVIALLGESHADAFAAELDTSFYVDADLIREAVRAASSFNVIDKRTFQKVDIFIPALGALGVGQLARRRPTLLSPGSRPLPVRGPEDIVLQK